MPAARRRRSEDEILDLDYLANNSSLDGMLSHLKPELRTAFVDEAPAAEVKQPMGQTPMGGSTEVVESEGMPERPMGQRPMGEPPVGQRPGRHRLHRCTSVRDGHTNGEQVAYAALWSHARRYGRPDEEGSYLVELGIAGVCQLLSTDHKHARKLLNSLEAKLAIGVAKPPDFRLNTPTVYRVFSEDRIAERRNAAGLIWVIRNRATRFVRTGTVE